MHVLHEENMVKNQGTDGNVKEIAVWNAIF